MASPGLIDLVLRILSSCVARTQSFKTRSKILNRAPSTALGERSEVRLRREESTALRSAGLREALQARFSPSELALQAREEGNQVRLLVAGQSDPEPLIVEVDDRFQVRGRAVVEVRGTCGHRAQDGSLE